MKKLAALTVACLASISAHADAIELSGSLTNFAWSVTNATTGEPLPFGGLGQTWTRDGAYIDFSPFQDCCWWPGNFDAHNEIGIPKAEGKATASTSAVTVYLNIEAPKAYFKMYSYLETSFYQPGLVLPAHSTLTFTADLSGSFSDPDRAYILGRVLFSDPSIYTAVAQTTAYVTETGSTKVSLSYTNEKDTAVPLYAHLELWVDGSLTGPAPIPEPSGIAFMALGLVGLHLSRPRKHHVVGA